MPLDLTGPPPLDDERRVVKILEARLRAREADIADLRSRLEFVTAIDTAKFQPPRWLAPPRSTKAHRATACLMLTDTHFGEVVTPAEVDFLNAYNDEIAEGRLHRFLDKGIRVARDYTAGVAYDGAVLFLGGDIFSGTIHDELVETNSETLYQAVVHWLGPMSATITGLADHFGRLHVGAVVGNHGRRTQRPRAKQRAQDNIEWLFYRVLERELRADKRITWQVSDSADLAVPVYSTKFLLTHGDQFRGGSGISGALAPLMLGSHRKARRAMTSGRPYDVMVMGHFHQYLVLPGPVIVGGTLKGLDEYAYLGNFGFEEPTQAFWVTTPERGITLSAPLHVQDRAEEGW